MRIYAEIIQQGNQLKITKNELPMQFSANIPIKIIKDEQYTDWLLVPYYIQYAKDDLPSQIRRDGFLLEYDNDTGITVLPLEAFEKKSNLFLTIGLFNPKTEERLYLQPVRFSIEGTLSGDSVAESISWEAEVVRFVDNYMRQHYVELIDGLLDKSTKLLEDSELLHKTVTDQQNLINELITTAESQQELASAIQEQASILQSTAEIQQDQVNTLVDNINTKLVNGEFDGKTVLYGKGLPSKDLGRIGDVYINTTGGDLYPYFLFTKDDEDWTPRWTMQGVNGTDTFPVMGTTFLPEELSIPKGYVSSNEYYIPAEYVGINENTPLPEALDNTNKRVTSLETNGVAVGDTLKIGSQVVYDGDDIPTGWKEVIPPFSGSNLLINGDTRVWQRGESFVGDSTQLSRYTADRWLCVFASGNNVLKSEDGSGLVYQRSTTDQSIIRQYVELDTKTSTLLVGKKVTMYQDIYVNTDVTIKYGVGVQRKTRTLTKGNNIITDTFLLTAEDIELKGGQKILDYLALSIDGNEILSINLRLAKLEVGELATPFIPKSYAEELQLCQWYYQVYENTPIRMTMKNASYHYYYFNLAEKLRSNGTVTFDNLSIVDINSNPLYTAPVGAFDVGTNDSRLIIRKTTSSTSDSVLLSSKIAIDAEIY